MASDLDPALIEAVAKALYDLAPLAQTWDYGCIEFAWDDPYISPEREVMRQRAVAAIRAVDAHRAAAVRAAVIEVIECASDVEQSRHWGEKRHSKDVAALDEARTALLALAGAQEETE